MKINWMVRFRNKTFLASLLALVVAFVFDLLGLLGIAPAVTEAAAMDAINAVLTVLGMLGVLIDPTTAGVGDSRQAMTYIEPKKD